jgi:hypothetical protein
MHKVDHVRVRQSNRLAARRGSNRREGLFVFDDAVRPGPRDGREATPGRLEPA